VNLDILSGELNMGIIMCTYPDNPEPLILLRELKHFLLPEVVNIDSAELYSKSIAQLEVALDNAGMEKSDFVPLMSMNRNAAIYAPQYKFIIESQCQVRCTGAVNKRMLNVIFDEPISIDLLRRLVEFGNTIPGATIEAEDDDGNSLLPLGQWLPATFADNREHASMLALPIAWFSRALIGLISHNQQSSRRAGTMRDCSFAEGFSDYSELLVKLV
jgi:hypothetical protein